MNVAEYAKKHNVSKQSVYDKIKRGTLQTKTIQGIKHIVSIPKVVSVENNDFNISKKKLEKTLKKLNKSNLKLEKVELKVEFLEKLIESKDKEILTLEKALSAFTLLLDEKENNIKPSITYEAIEEKKDKKKKKNKKKKS